MAQVSIDGGTTLQDASELLIDQPLAPHWAALEGAMDPAIIASMDAEDAEAANRARLQRYCNHPNATDLVVNTATP